MNAVMAREVPEVSVSRSSPAPAACCTAWWDHLLQASNSSSSSPAWSATMTHRWPPPLPPSNHRRSDALSSSYDDGAATSFTNDSSSADLSGDPSVADQNHHHHQQLWNQVMLNAERGADQNCEVVDVDGENFLRVLSSKRVINNDYAEKIEDSNWPPAAELLHPSSSSPSLKYLLEKHLGDHGNYNGLSRAANYSIIPDLISNWSLAPPSSTSHHLQPPTCNDDDNATAHHHAAQLSSSSCDPMMNDYSASFGMMRRESQMNVLPWFDGRINYLQHQMPLELQASTTAAVAAATTKPSSRVKGSDNLLFDGNHKQRCHSSSSPPMKGDNGTMFEGLKKKRTEESSEMQLIKKKKYDNSMVSSNNKLQMPKVKMAEKISALQQLVSPFGKTDQASVLVETINCIKVLQEQVQLLSDPYLKSGVSKEQNPWREVLEMRKEKDEASYDLRSRGLCLVPVSSIPQVHKESCRPDYWMPTFRSCFYR